MIKERRNGRGNGWKEGRRVKKKKNQSKEVEKKKNRSRQEERRRIWYKERRKKEIKEDNREGWERIRKVGESE